jgi:thiol-disulfide isomerase/thioredoxin
MRAILLTLLLAVPLSAETLTFEIAGMTCALCETNAEKALRGIKGVTQADVDLPAKRATVDANRALTYDEVRRALAKFGFDAGFADDPLPKRLSTEERAKADIATCSAGFQSACLAKGKVTIVDFYADWCGPCHALAPKLEHLVREDANVALRTIDLESWDSPAAKQATAEFKLPGLPYVRVYGRDGKFLGAVIGNDIEKIKGLVKRGAR